ncbi:hypothetical protein [Paraurantiacibacter namhicola]|uniref:Uncharacterized protein n=1 Tax=Paraurantiacibacter namhicola TaxID=645517 RepID=A0A1C7D7T3_9SPHN|nr:hypothetical protein [Paraurantiacibacter namhicola]ANU07534.1 hypothetical protein A6F65_01227 [Paraurantiacibacter namhicola]
MNTLVCICSFKTGDAIASQDKKHRSGNPQTAKQIAEALGVCAGRLLHRGDEQFPAFEKNKQTT